MSAQDMLYTTPQDLVISQHVGSAMQSRETGAARSHPNHRLCGWDMGEAWLSAEHDKDDLAESWPMDGDGNGGWQMPQSRRYGAVTNCQDEAASEAVDVT